MMKKNQQRGSKRHTHRIDDDRENEDFIDVDEKLAVESRYAITRMRPHHFSKPIGQVFLPRNEELIYLKDVAAILLQTRFMEPQGAKANDPDSATKADKRREIYIKDLETAFHAGELEIIDNETRLPVPSTNIEFSSIQRHFITRQSFSAFAFYGFGIEVVDSPITRGSEVKRFDKNSVYYPRELDIAVQAWVAVTTNSPGRGKAVKDLILEWLNNNYTEDQNRKGASNYLSKNAKDAIASICNWNKTGGAPTTEK